LKSPTAIADLIAADLSFMLRTCYGLARGKLRESGLMDFGFQQINP